MWYKYYLSKNMSESPFLSVNLPFNANYKDGASGVMNFVVICHDGYLCCRLSCDIPYNNEPWSSHPFGSLRDRSDESICEVCPIVADNEMTRELCFFIIDNYKHSDGQRAIRFLSIFDRKTFEKEVDDIDAPQRVAELEDKVIDPASSDTNEGLSSIYFFNKSCLTSNGIKILIRAKRTIYGGHVTFINYNTTNPIGFDTEGPVRFVDKGNLVFDKIPPETEMMESVMEERGIYLCYDIICGPYCTSSDETHPFYRIYSDKSYDCRRAKLRSVSNYVKCNDLMIAILKLISKPDIYLQEAKTSRTVRYRAYLIEFLEWMWD